MKVKSIYPLTIKGRVVHNHLEHTAVANGWEAADTTAGKPFTKPKKGTHA